MIYFNSLKSTSNILLVRKIDRTKFSANEIKTLKRFSFNQNFAAKLSLYFSKHKFININLTYSTKILKWVDVTEASALDNISIVTSCKDRKSTRLNSSHVAISYAVFCLKKKNRRYSI